MPSGSERDDLVRRAEALAREAHADHHRKGPGDVPYFTHLASVAARLRSFGIGDSVTLAAAYLHDVLEDRPAFEGKLRGEMPAEVVETVEALTERKHDAQGNRRSKRERFRDYVTTLASGTPAARRAIPVSCADKIDNLTSLVESQRAGVQMLVQLSTRPGEHALQAAELRPVYAPDVPPAMLAAFDSAVAALGDVVAGWLPGRAVAIAATAHLGQVDKAGAPYVFHPLRLMMRAETEQERMVAVLHDVVEDTPWTLAELRAEGFPPEVVAALDALTKRPGERYEDFIERVVVDPLARRVKLLDLEDNMDLTRLGRLDDADVARLERYHRARRRILQAES